jgi:hypothetical protein
MGPLSAWQVAKADKSGSVPTWPVPKFGKLIRRQRSGAFHEAMRILYRQRKSGVEDGTERRTGVLGSSLLAGKQSSIVPRARILPSTIKKKQRRGIPPIRLQTGKVQTATLCAGKLTLQI